ncbi:hypothetical protein Baya_11702 [Bagarius yarrelli]|uniref:Uncharacterized protein n=1 Tax=Bagarius yarrelli TaxID=175774 RepID=A0A556V1A0_BAGYA|nr:hypothetical protein Baya_11702 [Bagarius yarrelli]
MCSSTDGRVYRENSWSSNRASLRGQEQLYRQQHICVPMKYSTALLLDAGRPNPTPRTFCAVNHLSITLMLTGRGTELVKSKRMTRRRGDHKKNILLHRAGRFLSLHGVFEKLTSSEHLSPCRVVEESNRMSNTSQTTAQSRGKELRCCRSLRLQQRAICRSNEVLRGVNVTLKGGSGEKDDKEYEPDLVTTFCPTMTRSHICSSSTTNMTRKARFCSSAMCPLCYGRSQTIHQSIAYLALRQGWHSSVPDLRHRPLNHNPILQRSFVFQASVGLHIISTSIPCSLFAVHILPPTYCVSALLKSIQGLFLL